MKNQIRCQRQEIQVAAKSLAQAPLDAVTFVRFAQNLARSEPDPWPIRSGHGLRSQEPTHGRGLALARACVGALEISVAAQAEGRHRLLLRGMLRWGVHGKTAGNPAQAY